MGEITEEATDASKLDLWSSSRDLYQKIYRYIYQGLGDGMKPEEIYNLLLKHKQSFICLLQNPPKNTKSREELKKAMMDGITVKEIGHNILSRDLYQEAVIVSDMYELNEYVALDLLCTAQVQKSYHPDLPRGLVAVLLYYESRKFMVSTLKLLVNARKGVLWHLSTNSDLEKYIRLFTDQLLECGIFNRIFELLQTLDLAKEIEKLHENVALGGPRHQRQVINLFTDIRKCLSEIVYLWAAQTGLPKEPTIGLIGFLRQLKPEEDAVGVVDDVTIFMLLAALYAFDLSVLHSREDGEDVVQDLPILSDKEYILIVNDELSPNRIWVDKGVEGIVTLGFAITVSAIRLVPQYQESPAVMANQKNYLANSVGGLKVFNFLHSKVLPNPVVYSDEIIMRRFHYLFSDFIVYMFPEVKQLQVRTEESIRMRSVYVQEGLDPPVSLLIHFEHLMMCIAKFYSKDPLNLQYCLEYWCPVETNVHEMYSYRTPPRTLALYKFIKYSGDSVPGTSFVTFVNMLASLSTHTQAARHCFNLLKQNNQGFNKLLSWDHFFSCFNRYYNNLKQEIVQSDTVYRRFPLNGISPQEIEGLLSVLNLIKIVAEQDDFSRLALCEHPVWAPLTVLLGLVGCSVPIHFKASLIFTLAALSKSPEIATQMWNYIEASQILQTIPTISRYQPRGIQTELEEVESRIEEYQLTQSFLKLLDVLTDSGIPRTLGAGPRQPGFDPYLTYLVNSVFLKFASRTYKNQEERWIIACGCLKLFVKFLVNYEPQAVDFAGEFNPPPAYHLMVVMNSKSEFLNLILFIIDEGQKLFSKYMSLPGQDIIERCILHCLTILERVLILQENFMNLAASSPNPKLLTSLVKLLLLNNPRTGQPDHLISIANYITYYETLPKHALKVVSILTQVTKLPAVHSQFLNILLTFDKESKTIKNGFVECLDNGEMKSKEAILKLLKQCLGYATPNFTQFMLGFDLNQDISQMVFQHAGVLNFPRTCLHSIYTILKCTDSDETPSFLPVLESAYEIVCLLYSNSKTAGPIIRFTRLQQNFFELHIKQCLEDLPKRLAHLTWLFKTLAIDIKIACAKIQVLYLQQIIKVLTNMEILNPATSSLQKLIVLERLMDVIANNLSHAQAVNFIEAICQVIQVISLCIPFEVTPPKLQISITACLLHKILDIAVKMPLSSSDANHLSSSVVVLLKNIQKCCTRIDLDETEINLLNDVFKLLLRWFLVSEAGYQNLRIHLYVSVVIFLRIAYPDSTTETTSTSYTHRLNASTIQLSLHPLSANIPAMILKCGDRFIDLVCQDCVGGHDVVKMQAMITFSLLLKVTGDNSWIHFMVARGYLKYIINSILQSNNDLTRLLEPAHENLRVMYLFKAKLRLLLQIANTKVGAEQLLQHKTFACLSNLGALGVHPEIVKQSQVVPEALRDFIPGVDLRYLEIFLPTLHLSNATITTLSIDHYSAITQILDFIVSQLNAIEFVLGHGCPTLSSDFLNELVTVTSTIALISRANVAFVTKVQESFQNYNIPMLRVQKQMLPLLSKFILHESVTQELLANPHQEGDAFQTSNRLLYALQVIANTMQYLRNNITNKTILFKPSLGMFSMNLNSLCESESLQLPTIGTIVQHLVNFVAFYLEAKNTISFLKLKLSDIPSMIHSDLVELVKISYEMMDVEIVRKDAAEFITDKVTKKQREMDYAANIIDSSLYLLWVHLDHYMLQVIPRFRHGEVADGINFKIDAYGGTTEALWNVTVKDIQHLKEGLSPVFNDTFSRQLLETMEGTTEIKKQFVEMLVRKIKRLLQFVPVS